MKRSLDKTDSGNGGGDGENAYNKARLENIARNEEFLASLGLSEIKSTMEDSKPKKPASKRGTSARNSGAIKKVIPTRRSGRMTLERVKIELEDLKSAGGDNATAILEKEALIEELEDKKKSTVYEPVIKGADCYYEERERKANDAVMKISEPTNTPEEEDCKNLISMMKEMESDLSSPKIKKECNKTPPATKLKSPKKSWRDDYDQRLSKLSLKEEGVAKVVDNRITSIILHPSETKTLIAAGDKTGGFGIWDVDMISKGGVDGVYRYSSNFVAPIEKIGCRPRDDYKCYIGSRDGTIRFLDLNADQFGLAFCAPESIYDISFNSFDFNTFGTLGESILIGRGDGDLALVDPRVSTERGKSTYTTKVDIGGLSKMNTVMQHSTNENLVVSTFSGKNGGSIIFSDARKNFQNVFSLTVDDRRNPKSTLHSKSINAAHVSPDGTSLITVSQDNTIKSTALGSDGLPLLKDNKLNIASRSHDNHTGRWLSTFHPAFDPKVPNAFVCGSMNKPREFQVWAPSPNNTSIDKCGEWKGEHLNAVASRFSFHPTKDMFVGGNSSGRVYLIR